MIPPTYRIHRLLPADAQLDLRRASQIPITNDDPLARQRSVDQAIARVKRRYPQFFRTTTSKE